MVRKASSAYDKRAGIWWLPSTPFSFLFKVTALMLLFLDGQASTLIRVGSTETRSAYLRLTVTLLQQEKQNFQHSEKKKNFWACIWYNEKAYLFPEP